MEYMLYNWSIRHSTKGEKMEHCVVCGRLRGNNHRCPVEVEAAWQAAQTRANRDDDCQYDAPVYGENVRLFAGLRMMEMNGGN